MKASNIGELLRGVGLIIDDEVEKKGSDAFILAESIQSSGIPLLKYSSIPDESIIDCLGQISFIILDWGFSPELGDVDLGDEKKESDTGDILSFLFKLHTKLFVPVFIITGQEFGNVESKLIEKGLYSKTAPCRIMLKTKKDVQNYDGLLSCVEEWFGVAPSAFVLKTWDRKAVKSKNQMFLDLYSASPEWVYVLLDCICKDVDYKDEDSGKNNTINHEFNNLLNVNFTSRMIDGDYCSLLEKAEYKEPRAEEIRQVLEGERYIRYSSGHLPQIAYVGDLYKENDSDYYWVNIRAQCNLTRKKNPELYLVRGSAFDSSLIAKDKKIAVKKDGEDTLLEVADRKFSLKKVIEFEDQELSAMNADLSRMIDTSVKYSKGDIIEKKTHSIIPCIAGQMFIEFRFEKFQIMKKADIEKKATLIGRVLPPYITRLQKKFSSFIIREGTLAIPDSLLS